MFSRPSRKRCSKKLWKTRFPNDIEKKEHTADHHNIGRRIERTRKTIDFRISRVYCTNASLVIPCRSPVRGVVYAFLRAFAVRPRRLVYPRRRQIHMPQTSVHITINIVNVRKNRIRFIKQ